MLSAQVIYEADYLYTIRFLVDYTRPNRLKRATDEAERQLQADIEATRIDMLRTSYHLWSDALEAWYTEYDAFVELQNCGCIADDAVFTIARPVQPAGTHRFNYPTVFGGERTYTPDF